VSHVLFWWEGEYVAPASEDKPLVHTWSLAVEWQYCLFVPLLLIFAWRFGRDRVFWSIAILAAISLALSEWGWRNHPSANFYLAPARMWELFAGSLAALITVQRSPQRDNVLSLLGLGAILYAIFFYDDTIPFPSLYAAVPVLGTVLIVLYGHGGTLVGRLLGIKPMVVIGLLSYSAYLWHQPLFAFARIKSFSEPSALMMGGLSVLSLLLAAFSWKYIEQPFRAGKASIVQKQSHVFALSGVGLALFMGLGMVGHLQQGATWRFDNIAQLDSIQEESMNRAGFECHYTPNRPYNGIAEHCIAKVEDSLGKALLLGDSHAMSITPKVTEALNAVGVDSYSATYIGCLPLTGYRRFDRGLDFVCSDYVAQALEEARQIGIDTLILTARFPLYYEGRGYDNGEGGVERSKVVYDIDSLSRSSYDSDARRARFMQNFRDQITALSQEFNIVLVMPVPEHGWNVIDVAFKEVAFRDAGPDFALSSSFARYQERVRPVQELFDGLAAELDNVAVAHIQNGFCSAETGRCKAYHDGKSYYFDDDHLSLRGAEIAAEIIGAAVRDVALN